MANSRLNLVFLMGSLLVLVIGGCSSNNSSSSDLEALTLIGVRPEDFVSGAVCGTQVNSYVVSLYDVTGPAGIADSGVSSNTFFVSSSRPKSCKEATVFSNVVEDNAYFAQIDGYVELPAQLRPAYDDSLSAVSSAMIRTSDSQFVNPAWTATCYGFMDNLGHRQPGRAYSNITVNLTSCSQLGPSQ